MSAAQRPPTQGLSHQRDPLIDFLYQEVNFDSAQDVAVFERLISKYNHLADSAVAKLGHSANTAPLPSKDSFYALTFNTMEFRGQEERLMDYVIAAFHDFQLLEPLSLSEKTLRQWMDHCRHLYQNVAYHNFLHALDTFQFCCYLLREGQLTQHLSPHSQASLLLTAIGHDLAHPGLHKPYQGAITAVDGTRAQGRTLEACHLQLFLKSLEEPDRAVLHCWPEAERQRFRELAAALIAATDLNNHLVALNYFDTMMDHCPVDQRDRWECQRFLCQLALKCADISNVVRPFGIAELWGTALEDELSDGGSIQASQPSRIAFIDFIAKPLFATLLITLPGTVRCVKNLHDNRSQWVRARG